MANLSNYGSDVISKVPHSEPYHNDMENQSVHAMQDFEQTPVAAVQDTNLHAQQDAMILSVIEQMSKQMINHINNWEKANKEKNNESLTVELERYKERVKTFEQRLNIDLSTRKKFIDSQMDDMIKEKLALKQQIDSLEQNLSNQIKEKESLLHTFIVFKNESKEKESKYMENEIDLEKKIKELDNIVYKVIQSAQTVHMLTKPQVFYDDTHKQALGYQNSFYLKKAQRIKPTLYDDSVISSQHAAMPVIDDEETLILEEVSRSKMLAKQNDPISKEKKVNTTLINYVELNKLSEDFGKCFVSQQELFAEQAFWLQTSNPNTEQFDISPGRIEAPSELPKVILVNTILKKLKFHLSKFDTVVKKQITPNAITEGEWGKRVKQDMDEIETINIELEHSVAKLLFKNERLHKEIDHLKQNYRDQFDLIKRTRVHTKEHSESLILQLNSKSVETAELKAQIQDKVFVITSLKNDLRKLKGKEIVENAAQIPIATTIAPVMFKLDLEPISHSLKNNRDAHEDYIKKTIEHTDTIRGLVEHARKQNPSEPLLDSACRIEEFY
ncbi:hypothetical protein Tco_1563909 [Tanacetum coccineum]